MTEQKRPYKVLLVDLARSFGGAEVRVQTQASALVETTSGCAVAVLANSPLHERLTQAGIPCEVVDVGRASPALAMRLVDIIRKGGYQIVDAHNVQSILWGHIGARMAGVVGCVATIHSDYGAEYPGIKGRVYEGVLGVNRMIARQYINVTEVLQAKSEAMGLKDRATLIHNAVPIPPLPLPQPDHDLRGSWGIAPNEFAVGIVARLKPVKGHTYLIDAMAEVRDLPIKLVVLGDGPLRGDLEAQAQARGVADRVHFAGFSENIIGVLPSLDAVCMASLSEALPYAVLEAASYARPLLVTKVGGLATLLEHQKTAYMVPAQNPTALAEGMRWLAAHREAGKALGMAGYEMVRGKFSLDHMIQQILAVYDRALSG